MATTLLDRCLIADRATVDDDTGGQTVAMTPRTGEPDLPAGQHRCRFVKLRDDEVTARQGTPYGDAVQGVVFAWTKAPVPEGSHITNVLDGGVWIVVGRDSPDSVLAVFDRYLLGEV